MVGQAPPASSGGKGSERVPAQSIPLVQPTWPKFTAACWAEAVKITTVRYSDSFSRLLIDLGKPKAKPWLSPYPGRRGH